MHLAPPPPRESSEPFIVTTTFLCFATSSFPEITSSAFRTENPDLFNASIV